jgi:2-polyprenyl-6-methoxyphenol hydroxylase-like FAD-dependent oxidoreductase
MHKPVIIAGAGPVGLTLAAGGRQLINTIAELSVPDFEQNDQDWNKEVSIDVFKAPFQSWTFGWIDIPALIDNCEHEYEFPLSDRDPLPCWAHGNMTVVGDAAHPMYPIGSNGASQGILDAEKLAVELSRSTDIPAAFAAYEAERRPATQPSCWRIAGTGRSR